MPCCAANSLATSSATSFGYTTNFSFFPLGTLISRSSRGIAALAATAADAATDDAADIGTADVVETLSLAAALPSRKTSRVGVVTTAGGFSAENNASPAAAAGALGAGNDDDEKEEEGDDDDDGSSISSAGIVGIGKASDLAVDLGLIFGLGGRVARSIS